MKIHSGRHHEGHDGHTGHGNHDGHSGPDGHAAHGGHQGHGGGQAGGLAVSAGGFTLDIDSAILAAGPRQRVGFRVLGPDGRPVTEFVAEHEKELHFIAVRRDTAGFQHVHPVRDEKGDWSTELDLEPGDWRFFADIHPAGHDRALTLGIDVAVAGPYAPLPLPEAARTSHVGAYDVTLGGTLVPGEASELTLTVSRDGEPVTDLEPYLAAYGHLVALRVGDLGYLHVHPEGHPGDGTTAPGPAIRFLAVAPTAGAYRLFLDFQHAGVVRTASFTAHTSTEAAPSHGEHHGPHAHH
ncbi:hypothetical protein EAO70_09170 [Streptomyces sp. adm13(2018)]|uniref:hypothetical protein n=1 Tax=unclassified Streptomyces TaxID=2593676 RepID=UPI0011CE62A8|nr:hypothetical protein [Streptomyces sp. adm13(2018)]TXS20330.1 hypothetical protein EAO70_09170 [Streptomyces sp. adm13(2018)]